MTGLQMTGITTSSPDLISLTKLEQSFRDEFRDYRHDLDLDVIPVTPAKKLLPLEPWHPELEPAVPAGDNTANDAHHEYDYQ